MKPSPIESLEWWLQAFIDKIKKSSYESRDLPTKSRLINLNFIIKYEK